MLLDAPKLELETPSKNLADGKKIMELRKQPKEGKYAIANRFPSSLKKKPTPHFCHLQNDRELFGRLTLAQCRCIAALATPTQLGEYEEDSYHT